MPRFNRANLPEPESKVINTQELVGTHGIGTTRKISPVAREIYVRLIDEATESQPQWILVTDKTALMQYARAEARSILLQDLIWDMVERGGPESVPMYLWDQATKADALSLKMATALGLNPEGRMKIAKDAGFAQHFRQEALSRLRDKGAELRSTLHPTVVGKPINPLADDYE